MAWKGLIHAIAFTFMSVPFLLVDSRSSGPCDEGWLYFSGKCYRGTVYDNLDLLNWRDSEMTCMQDGGHLVAIHSHEELEFLVSYLLEDMRSNVWIGLHYLNTYRQSEYIWTDGSSVNYTIWLREERRRNLFSRNEYCVEMVYSNSGRGKEVIGEWNRISCYDRRPFICKKNAYYLAATPTIPAVGGNCGAEWLHFRKKCYRIGHDREPWNAAANRCTIYGGHLVTIQSKDELDFLVNSVLRNIQTDVWIGLYDRIKDSEFFWHDGSPVNYTNWLRNEPTGNEYDQYNDCVYMIFSQRMTREDRTGKWNDVQCDRSFAYICQRKIVDEPSKIPDDSTFCDKGWLYFYGKCYRSSDRYDRKSWNGAASRCTNYGGHLVTIQSSKEFDFLVRSVIRNIKKSAWIGFHDQGGENKFSWQDGSVANYTNWKTREPSGSMYGEEDCVAMSYSGRDSTTSGKWNDASCYEEFNFICQKKTDLVDFCVFKCGENPDTECKGDRFHEADVECKCKRDGYLFDEDRKECRVDYCIEKCGRDPDVECINRFDQKAISCFCRREQSFDEEQRKCRADYCIITCGRNSDVVCVGHKYNRTDVGCRCSSDDSSFNERKKRCSKKSPLKWNFDADTTCDAEWIYSSGKCYTSSDRHDRLSWYDAADRCMSYNGHLLTIESEEELQFVVQTLLPRLQSNVWIGLHDEKKTMEYSWHDKSSVNFTNWRPNEPSGKLIPGEDCVEMVYSPNIPHNFLSGQWNDLSCTNKLPYMCQKKTVPLVNFCKSKCGEKLDVMCFGPRFKNEESVTCHCKRDGLVYDEDLKACRAARDIIFKNKNPVYTPAEHQTVQILLSLIISLSIVLVVVGAFYFYLWYQEKFHKTNKIAQRKAQNRNNRSAEPRREIRVAPYERM